MNTKFNSRSRQLIFPKIKNKICQIFLYFIPGFIILRHIFKISFQFFYYFSLIDIYKFHKYFCKNSRISRNISFNLSKSEKKTNGPCECYSNIHREVAIWSLRKWCSSSSPFGICLLHGFFMIQNSLFRFISLVSVFENVMLL